MTTATLGMLDHPVRVGLDDAGAAVDAARRSDVWALSDDDLAVALADCEALAARSAELALVLVREADDRDLGRRLGASSTAAWLRGRLRLRPGEAKARVDLAHRLRGSDHAEETVADWAATVGVTPGRGSMPATGAGLRAGVVSADHARVIAGVLARIPAHVDDSLVARVEADLAGWARQHDPRTLARLGEHLLHVLDTDTLADEEDKDYSRRELRLNEDTGTVRGRLDREGLALLWTALDPLAAPCPADDGTPDPRSPARRLADALVELAERSCDTGDLPTARGTRPHLSATIDLDTLRSRADTRSHGDDTHGDDTRGDDTVRGRPGGGPVFGQPGGAPGAGVAPGEMLWGGPISAEAVRRIACDAGVSRVITDGAGVPLDVGREYRTVTPGQFVALVARDGGCAFPGCTRPASWCEAHHIVHWADGGITSLDNLVLLCGHHHRTIHHRGWTVRLAPDRLPEFIPPAWIDPEQRPRRNTRPRHHRQRPG